MESDTRLVLLGHSFGGTTVRLFAELLANGDAAEKSHSSCSRFFTGEKGKFIHSVVTLASPMNGTTAYDLFSDPAFDPESVQTPWWENGLASMMSTRTKPKKDGRDESDYADYDMHIDHAAELNRRITTLSYTYYFSVPCSTTKYQEDGTCLPEKGTEPMFVMRSCQIGAYKGKTAGGILIDEGWRENDGLVNTVSAMAPMQAPSKTLDRAHIEPGIWNVFPVIHGDHMWLQGGLLRKHYIRGFYMDLLGMIDKLGDAIE